MARPEAYPFRHSILSTDNGTRRGSARNAGSMHARFLVSRMPRSTYHEQIRRETLYANAKHAAALRDTQACTCCKWYKCSRPTRSTCRKVHMSNRPGSSSMTSENAPAGPSVRQFPMDGGAMAGMTWSCSFVAGMSGERACPKNCSDEAEKCHHYRRHTSAPNVKWSIIEPSQATLLPGTTYATCLAFRKLRLGLCALGTVLLARVYTFRTGTRPHRSVAIPTDGLQ